MGSVSLDGLYDTAYKASQSDASFNAGNKSLSNLVQQILPFTESGVPGNILIQSNNGNLTAEYPYGYAPPTFDANAKQSNISLGQISRLSSSWSQWNFANQSTVAYRNYSMVYKYVPVGYTGSWTNKIEQQKECLQKIGDVVNFSSVNISSSLPAELSGSWGLPWISGSAIGSGVDGNPFGTLNCKGLSTSYFYHQSNFQNNKGIPCGSGSYKVPQSGDNESVVFMFWLKVPSFPENNTAIWCNSMPIGTTGGSPGNEPWSPYNGYMCQVTSNGSLIFIRGDDTGASSTDRRSFRTTWQMDEDKWNFIAVRLHASSNSVTTTTNWCWGYRDGGRGYTWNNGLQFVSGTGGSVSYRNRYGMVVSPGTNNRYFTGSIGHFYIFWEANTNKLGFDKFDQTRYTTNSGSYNLYSTT